MLGICTILRSSLEVDVFLVLVNGLIRYGERKYYNLLLDFIVELKTVEVLG
jgi:hypothetical protein